MKTPVGAAEPEPRPSPASWTYPATVNTTMTWIPQPGWQIPATTANALTWIGVVVQR